MNRIAPGFQPTRRHLKSWIAAVSLTGIVACAMISKQAYERGQLLDQTSREQGCQRANQTLVLLGGGMDGPELLSKRSLARVAGTLNFLATERAGLPRNTLVTSGGPVYSRVPGGPSEANLMANQIRAALERIKTKIPLKIIEENRSMTTRENARYSAELFDSLRMPREIILLTEVLHLERATRDFEREGFRVCPVSVAGVKSGI